MSKVAKNIVTHGLSGKLDDLIVFRQRAGKTIVAAKPSKMANPTDVQLQHREHFQEAVIYAKGVLADPQKKEAYEPSATNGRSVYNVALADFLKAPKIEEIDISDYTGQPGGVIRVRAIDDFKVAEVSVNITTPDGTEIEQGLAVQDTNLLDWIYTATTTNNLIQGNKIVVLVSDVPGGQAEGTQTV
jgi:hypothetical protein